MIAAWMLAATALALLVGVAALALERALRLLHRPGRGAWMLALVAACLWPVLAPALRAPATPTVTTVVTTTAVGPVFSGPIAPIIETPDLRARLAALDTPLTIVWAVLSTLLLLRALAAVRALRRLAGAAESRTMGGRPVLIAPDTGPAAFGIVTPRIVLPRWALDLEPPMRDLVLRHEVEHLATADPAVLTVAWFVAALMPWNPGLWWIVRRLRIATELDCDRRVMRHGTDTRRYAHLLLLMAQRQGQATFASMIAGAPSTLHERIAAMHATPPARPFLRAAALLAVALIAGSAAASPALARELANIRDRIAVPLPPVLESAPVRGPAVAPVEASPVIVAQDTTKKATTMQTTTVTKTLTTTTRTPGFRSDSQANFAQGSPAPRYPSILKEAGVSGVTIVQLVVDTAGLPITSSLKVVRSSHELFTKAVTTVVPAQLFLPALVKGRPVKQLVQIVYFFQVHGMAPVDTALPPTEVRTLKVYITGIPQQRAGTPTTGAVSPSTPPTTQPAYFEYQVDAPVQLAPGGARLTYPIAQRAAGIEATVLAQFIVGADGVVEAGSFRLVKATTSGPGGVPGSSSPDDPNVTAFAAAVRDAVAASQYTPGKLRGTPVRQVVQQPFVFALSAKK